jgi:hypothetical protein
MLSNAKRTYIQLRRANPRRPNQGGIFMPQYRPQVRCRLIYRPPYLEPPIGRHLAVSELAGIAIDAAVETAPERSDIDGHRCFLPGTRVCALRASTSSL